MRKLILPTNEGHPVKRVKFATDVDHDKKNDQEKVGSETTLPTVQVRGVKAGRNSWCCTGRTRPQSSRPQLYDWRQKVRRQRSQGEVEQTQATEIARLKRQVAEQSEELAILKKAATYFAKNLK
jgi:hypothetical protein